MIWIYMTLAALVVLVLARGAALYFEWRSIYFPSKELLTTPDQVGLAYEEAVFVSEDRRMLHGWWIPHQEARGTVIYCHGNASNVGDLTRLAVELHCFEVNVFVFDYRGYGRSKGLPGEEGTYQDACAAYEVCRARHGDQEEPPIVAYGSSLGGAVAIELARRRPLKGLIVEASFSSIVEMGEQMYPNLPVRQCCRFKYDSVAKVGSLSMPKLFSHSRSDEVIPYAFGRKLYDAAAEPKQFIELPGLHNNTGPKATPEYGLAIQRFLADVLTEETSSFHDARS